MAGSGTGHLGRPSHVMLHVEHLVVEYKAGSSRKVHALSDVSFDVRRGETLGLVGESGCGKSTTARAVTMLTRPSDGTITFDGRTLTNLTPREVRRMRANLQLIFQDPISSLNSRRTVRAIVSEGLSITRAAKPWRSRVDDALSAVGLDPAAVGNRYPAELSGGQCQRVAIARALMLNPSMLVCDEPVSALDVSVQAQILNLLEDMKEQHALTMLFIAHDLAVVKNISDRVAVMYLGKICEIGPSDELYANPRHPYTQALISAIPEPDPLAETPPMLVKGELPSPLDPPTGCRFRTRCPRATGLCANEEPQLIRAAEDHWVACHHPGAGPSTGLR